MLNMQKYQTMEAIEDLLDDYDLLIASLDAEIALINEKNQIIESKMKVHKPPHEKVFGYQRLTENKKEFDFHELMKQTYQQYQDGLREKLNNIQRGEE